MHRRHKKPYAVIFVAVLLLVVSGALWDMHKLNNPEAEPKTALRYHYVDDAGDFARLPRDTSPLFMKIGTLHKQTDGTYALENNDIEPITLPQREVNLVISFSDLPSAMASFGEAIEQEINRWKRKNNKIVEVVLDWQTDTPDTGRLLAAAQALRQKLKMDFWIGVTLKRGWFEADPAQAQSIVTTESRGVRSYVYSIPEATKDGETLEQTIAALDSFGIRYLLRIAEPPAPKEAQRLIETHEKLLGFVGQP